MANKKSHVALTKCFFCGGDGCILLATRYNHDGEPLRDLAPAHGKICNMEPCSKCADYMKQGIIFLGIDDAKSEPGWSQPPQPQHIGDRRPDAYIPNPFRTGAFAVIKEEAVRRMINSPKMVAWAVKHRWMFIEHAAMVQMGIIKQGQEVG